MFGGKDTFKRKTKIKKDRGSSSDEGGEYHEKTKIKQKRKGAKGTLAPTGIVPGTVGVTRGRGRRSSSSSSSSSDNRQRNVGNIGTGAIGTTGLTTFGQPLGVGPTGYTTSVGPTSGISGYNQPTHYSTKQTQPGFVEKMKYKLRSRKR